MSPLILVAVPLAVAPITFLLQRRATLASALSAMASLLWAGLCLTMPLAPSLEVLGRTIGLSPLDRLALSFLGLEATLLTLIEGKAERQVTFGPAVLLMLSVVTAALTASHVGVAAILVSLAALIAVFIMAGSPHSLTLSAPGYLTLMVVAALLLVAAAWLGDLATFQVNPVGTRPVVILMAVGLGVLLALPPFHAWWVVTVRHSPAALAGFLGTMLPMAGLLLLMEFLQANPWATIGGSLARTLTIGGLLAGLLGGVLAAAADDLSTWVAYSAIAGTGSMLAGVGTMTMAGAAGAGFLLLNQGLSLALIIACRAAGWTALARTIGALSLSGVPLTAGFVGRWLIYRPLLQQSPLLSTILILSGFCSFVGYLRTWHDVVVEGHLVETGRRAVFSRLLAVGLVVAVLVLGVIPGPILSSIVEALKACTFLSP